MWQWASITFCGCVAMSCTSEGGPGLAEARLELVLAVELLRRHERRLVHQPRAVGRIELDDLELPRGVRAVEREVDGDVQRAPRANVHREALRPQRRDVLEEHHPRRAGALGVLQPP